MGKQLVISSKGFPGTNKTWRFIQDAFTEPLEALARNAGNKTIITGITLTDGVYSSGFISYEGEILPFAGGALSESVTIIEEVEQVTYNVDQNNDGQLDTLPGYKTRYAKFGSEGVTTFPFNNLTRLKSLEELSAFELPEGMVIDSNYIALTQAMVNKLAGIAEQAEVNVQADWNAVNNLDDAYIKNKPVNVARWLLTPRTVYVGDVYTDTNIPISFPTVGNTDYIVVGHLISYGTEWNYDNDVVWMVKDLTPTGFKLLLKEVSGDTQMLRFKYGLISL